MLQLPLFFLTAMLSWTLQILAQKPGRGSCCCMRRVSIYIDVSSLYPVQGTALTYAPGGCRTFMHYEAVLLAQHPHFTVMIHGNNIISLKLFAFFVFWFLVFSSRTIVTKYQKGSILFRCMWKIEPAWHWPYHHFSFNPWLGSAVCMMIFYSISGVNRYFHC